MFTHYMVTGKSSTVVLLTMLAGVLDEAKAEGSSTVMAHSKTDDSRQWLGYPKDDLPKCHSLGMEKIEFS